MATVYLSYSTEGADTVYSEAVVDAKVDEKAVVNAKVDEKALGQGLPTPPSLRVNKYSRKFERQTLRRVDRHLLPLLIAVYALALMDRNNLGIARVAGMGQGLDKLDLSIGNRFSISSAVYFVPYILLELPSNLVLRWITPRVWLSFITISWGIIQLCEAFVKEWWWLAVCRTLLGAGEAGFFPAVAYIITTWYTRYEVQKRLAVFYLVAMLVGGFSSILAWMMTLLNGKAGLKGWQWIFVIEGVVTIALGILIFFFVADFPDRNQFLTQRETEFILQRIEDDRGDSVPDRLPAKKALGHLLDWKMWVFGLMFMTQTMPAYFIGFFLPVMLNSPTADGGMGWNTRDSLLLCSPPAAVALVSAMTFAWLSDRAKLRAPFLFVQTCISITGICITAYHPKAGVRYFGMFLVTAGSSGCIPGILAYAANNTLSQSKRAVSNAVIIAFGGIGAIMATMIFRQKDYPRYRPGLHAMLGLQVVNIALLVFMTMHFRSVNHRVRCGWQRPIEGRRGFYYTL